MNNNNTAPTINISTITNSSSAVPTSPLTIQTTDTIFLDKEPSISIRKKTFILVFASLSFIENVILLMAILTSPKLRKKVTFIFVINLLFSQMLVATVTLPMYCYAPNHFLYGYVTALTIIAYILNLCTVTLERYLAICRPYIYCKHVSTSKTIKYSLACWVISFIIQMLPIFWKDSENEEFILRVYLGFTWVLFFILPLFFIWFCNAFICIQIIRLKKNQQHEIGKLSAPVAHEEEAVPFSDDICLSQTKLQNHGQQQHQQQNKQHKDYTRNSCNNNESSIRSNDSSIRIKSVKFKKKFQKSQKEIQLALVFAFAEIAYNITWIPVIIMVFLQIIKRRDLEPSHLSEISVFLLALNANLDPLIYGLFLRPLRAHLVNTASRICTKLTFSCRSN